MNDLHPNERRRLLIEEIERYTKILDELDSWEITGSMKQPIPHWALRERRAAMQSLLALEKQHSSDPGLVDELEAFLADK